MSRSVGGDEGGYEKKLGEGPIERWEIFFLKERREGGRRCRSKQATTKKEERKDVRQGR